MRKRTPKTPPGRIEQADASIVRAAGFLNEQQQVARRAFHGAAAAALVSGFLLIPVALCMAQAVDGVIFHGKGLGEVAPWLIGLGVLYVLRAALSAVADYTAGAGAAAVALDVRRQLTRALWARLLQQGGDNRTGAAITAAVEGVGALHPYYAQYLPARAVMVFLPLAILVVVYPVDWVSGIIMSVTAPVIPFFMVLIGRGAEKLNQKQWKRLSVLGNHFLEAIQGMTTLKLLNASKREGRLLALSGDAYRRETMSVLRIAFLSSLTLEFFATVSIALVAVLVGFRLLWGDIPFERGFMVLLLAPEFYLPLRRMGAHYHARMEALAAAEKIDALLQSAQPARAGAAWTGAGAPALAFKDVTYLHDGRDAGVRGLTLAARAGRKTVLIGPSGCGKSTALALALGFIAPQAGRITADGQDLAGVDGASWRARLSYVSQRPRLFAGSVMDAIRMGHPEADEAAILAIADHLGIGDIARQRRVAEDGRGLSGGQMQRVELARALIRPSGLLVMDEPAAQVDAQSAARMESALKAFGQGRTILMTAHHLASVRDADCIHVMEAGRAVASGTHDALLQDSAYYRACIDAFSGGGAS